MSIFDVSRFSGFKFRGVDGDKVIESFERAIEFLQGLNISSASFYTSSYVDEDLIRRGGNAYLYSDLADVTTSDQFAHAIIKNDVLKACVMYKDILASHAIMDEDPAA